MQSTHEFSRENSGFADTDFKNAYASFLRGKPMNLGMYFRASAAVGARHDDLRRSKGDGVIVKPPGDHRRNGIGP
jgi:hypothetical protein